jgi:UDP-N-acetylmuramate--alanine ligase
MAGRRSIAVAGTHGKTSTTSMLTVAVQACGVDPSFAIGGDLNESGSNAHAGEGDVFVAEADESDRSFLLLKPFAGIVTNVEADHLDNYGDLAAVEAAFDTFLDTVHPDGFVVLCLDDPGAARLRGVPTKARLRTYGLADDADLRLLDLDVAQDGTSYTAVLDGRVLGRVRIQLPGEHMALNSAAALLAGLELGLPAEGLIDGLARFGGVHRRFELKGVAGGVRVYDDYAHHPTEVSAQLRAARAVAGRGRLVVAFQPHLYSRTLEFADGFGRALGLADEVVIMDVYGAREDPVPGVTGAMVADAVPLPPERVLFEPSWSAAAPALAARARPGDLVMTMGAGDVSMVGPEVLEVLRGGGTARGGSS